MSENDRKEEPKNIRLTSEYKYLMVLMNKAGIIEREQRLYVASRILKKEVSTFKQLSPEEISQVLLGLRSWEAVQEQRLFGGSLFYESMMITDLLLDKTKVVLSEDGSILSTEKGRKEFMAKNKSGKYEIDMDAFDQELSKLASSLKTEVKTLPVDSGRWDSDKIISAPVTSLGLAIGTGGIPRGKIIQLWGQKHAGKTLLCNNLIAQAQREGIPTVLLDVEAASTGDFMEKLGVKIDDLKVIYPGNIERLGKLLRGLSRTGAFIVVDSIAAAESIHELNRDTEKDAARVGGSAMQWKTILNIIRGDLLETGTTVVLINQVRTKIGASKFESDEKPYGTEAIQHASDLSIKVSKVREQNDTLRKNKYTVSRLRFEKNRFSGFIDIVCDLPFKPGFPYNRGVDLARVCSESPDPTVPTYSEMANYAIVSGKAVDPSSGELIDKTNRWSIRIDPLLMAAIKQDDEEFEEVDIEPLADWDGETVTDVDVDNSEYYTIPSVGIVKASAWLQHHPTARDVLSERILNSLNRVKEFLADD